MEYYQKKRIEARVTQCVSNLKNITTAIEMYDTDHQCYPSSLKQLVPNYLRVIPSCAAAGKDTYSSSYRVLDGGKNYVVYCQGHYHKKAGLPANYPRYEEKKGLFIKPGVQDKGNLKLRNQGKARTLLNNALIYYSKKDYRNSRIYVNKALKSPYLDSGGKILAKKIDQKLKAKGY